MFFLWWWRWLYIEEFGGPSYVALITVLATNLVDSFRHLEIVLELETLLSYGTGQAEEHCSVILLRDMDSYL